MEANVAIIGTCLSSLHQTVSQQFATMPQQKVHRLAPKRIAPPQVAPVLLGGLRIEVVHWGKERGLEQNGGYLEAFDRATGAARWLLRVYAIDCDPALEGDVQDLFIAQLQTGPGDTLIVIDEQDRRFAIDPATRSVSLD